MVVDTSTHLRTYNVGSPWEEGIVRLEVYKLHLVVTHLSVSALFALSQPIFVFSTFKFLKQFPSVETRVPK